MKVCFTPVTSVMAMKLHTPKDSNPAGAARSISIAALVLAFCCAGAAVAAEPPVSKGGQGTQSAASAPAELPDAAAILADVRAGQAVLHQTLSGKLRTGARTISYRMVMEGPSIRFDFPNASGSEPKSVNLKFGEKDVALQVQPADGKAKTPVFEEELFGMGVTYEDLAMRFLYWPRAVIEGEERMMLMSKCWKIRVQRPAGSRSLYREVLIWVSQSNGAFLKSEAYGEDGAVSRRMTVRSLQSVGQATTLKQLRVESPGRRADPTYLDVDAENAAQAPR